MNNQIAIHALPNWISLKGLTGGLSLLLMAGVERGTEVQPRWTTEVYYKGYRILLTLPFKNAEEAVGLMNDLSNLGFTSVPRIEPQALPQPEEKVESKENVIPICAIHNRPMVQRQGKYGKFWACPVKEGGIWCKFRPPKE